MKRSKKYREAVVKVDVDKVYAVQDQWDAYHGWYCGPDWLHRYPDIP